jgi:hypothetical protein
VDEHVPQLRRGDRVLVLVHELLHELASEGLSYEDLPSWGFEIPVGSL